MDDTYGCLALQSVPRAETSDKDTLILALELVLKIAARSPPFKVRFLGQEQPSAGVTPQQGACLPVSATCSSSFSNNKTLDLPELASNDPSQDFSGDMLFWDDFLSPDPCLSNPWAQQREENIWSDDSGEEMNVGDELDPACQIHPAEGTGLIVSDISQTSQSDWDSVDDEDNNKFMSWMVGLTCLPRRS
jgi:hypothetical protein